MTMKCVLLFFCIAILATGVRAQAKYNEADAAAILAEIGRITQAFIDVDIETIYKTHSEDWSGFLNDGQVVPIKGIDAYMKAYGFQWPPPAGYKPPGPNPAPHRKYKITNYLCVFVTPDTGVASFTLDYPSADGKSFNRLRIMDVFNRRDGRWIQTASDTKTDPAWKAANGGKPLTNLPPQFRDPLLKAREAVWRAYFANDKAALDKLLPAELITMDSGPEWGNKTSVMESAQKFADSGGKLVKLEFPKTEMQVYANGAVAIIYTTYLYELEVGGKRSISTGRATEMFTRQDGAWVNTGWHLDATPKTQ